MNEAESPQRKKFTRKWLALGLCALLLILGFTAYKILNSSGSANNFLNKTVILVSKTIRDVLGLGIKNKLAVEINLVEENPARAGNPDYSVEKEKPPQPAEVTPSPKPQVAPQPSPPPPASGSPNHIVISAVQISGSSSANDFIKIYNPTNALIDINGWKLRKKTSAGSDESVRVFTAGSVIEPRGYFLWANSEGGFAKSVGANESSTRELAANNSVALTDSAGNIIDAVAWGGGTSQYVEGSAYPKNPNANQILSRKFVNGLIQDTESNAQDFEIR